MDAFALTPLNKPSLLVNGPDLTGDRRCDVVLRLPSLFYANHAL